MQGSGFRVQGLGFRAQGLGFRVSGLEFRVQGFGLRVSGFGFRVSLTRWIASDPGIEDPETVNSSDGSPGACRRERVLYRKPTGPNPLYHRDDQVDRPRAMGV